MQILEFHYSTHTETLEKACTKIFTLHVLSYIKMAYSREQNTAEEISYYIHCIWNEH